MATPSTSSTGAAGPATPRIDFYQTDTVVTVSIFVKSASADTLHVDITPHSLDVRAISAATGSEYVFRIDPLFSTVDPASSSYKVLSTKIDVILHKAQPGVRWVQLQGGAQNEAVVSAATPSYAASQEEAKKTAPRARSKWDSLKLDEDDEGGKAEGVAKEEGAGSGGDADINKFFQKLYADADDDTRRAMMKSYQESGGTTLSTDWSKVGREQVKTQPPDGMEAKKW